MERRSWSIGAQFGAQLPFQLFPGNWPLPAANIRDCVYSRKMHAVMPNLSFHGTEEIGNQLEQRAPIKQTLLCPRIIHRRSIDYSSSHSIFPSCIVKFSPLSRPEFGRDKFHPCLFHWNGKLVEGLDRIKWRKWQVLTHGGKWTFVLYLSLSLSLSQIVYFTPQVVIVIYSERKDFKSLNWSSLYRRKTINRRSRQKDTL